MVIDLKPIHYFDQNIDEKDKFGSSGMVGEEDKSKENHHYFDHIAKRVRWAMIDGK